MDDSVERHNEVGSRRAPPRLPTRRGRDRPVQVRKGAIGPPTNFQHVAHVGFSDSAIPEVTEDGRTHEPTRRTSSNQRETSDSKTGNLSCKSLDGEEDPLWDNQDWYTRNGDGGQWANQSCCSPDDGQREDQRWTVSQPLPLTSDDSDQPLRPSSVALRKDMIGPPTNFQHVFHVDKNSDRELQLIREVSISRPGVLHPKTQESLPGFRMWRDVLQEAGHHDPPSGTPPSQGASGPSAAGVRNGMIGPPTNFQHVEHVGFSDGSSLQVVKDQQLRDPPKAISWEEEQLSDSESYNFRRNAPDGEVRKHRSRWQTHRWSSPIGDLNLQEAQLGSQRWPSLDEDCSYQPMTEASVNRRQKSYLQTPGPSSNVQQREGLEARRQQQQHQQRAGRRATRASKSGVQPPPCWVRVIPGSPADQLGFIKDTTWQVSEEQELQDPTRAGYVDGQRESDSRTEDNKHDLPDTDRGQQEAQWENHRWPSPDDARNHEAQWENHRWPSPDDARNHEAQWENHRWPNPDDARNHEAQWESHRWPSPDGAEQQEEACLEDHLWLRPHTTQPLSPAPGRLRKDSIGPPTNFHHVLHIDRHSTEHELQQLMANLNKEGTLPLKTHKSLPDLVEHGGNQDTGHHTTDLPWPTGAPVPPAGIRKEVIGPPTNFQHVTHVGFGDKRSVGVSEEHQPQQDPATATSWDGHYLSDPETRYCSSDGVNEHGGQQTHLKSQSWSDHDGDCPEEEIQRQIHQYSLPGGQQVAQETQQWSIPGVDSSQQVAQEIQQWSIPPPPDDSSPSLAQPPYWLRKDMIGPPTNFQHIFHLDRDNVDQEIQQMLREQVGVDLQPLSDPKTQRIVNDVTERQCGQEEASGRSTTPRDLPDPAKPGRVRKDMIGPPTNFQHVSHVGLSSTTTWQVSED